MTDDSQIQDLILYNIYSIYIYIYIYRILWSNIFHFNLELIYGSRSLSFQYRNQITTPEIYLTTLILSCPIF